MATFVVVLGTANHWLLDAAGGVVTLSIAYLLQYAVTGQRLGEHQVPIIRRSASAFTGDAVSLAVPVRGGGPTRQTPVGDTAHHKPSPFEQDQLAPPGGVCNHQIPASPTQ